MSLLGRMVDRSCFWNLPGFIKSYELPVDHHCFFHQGVEVWHVPGRQGAPTVLFCHGNSGNLRFPNARRNRFLALHQAGVHLWAFDYRGYGKSTGSPTEQGLYEDARAVHQLVRDQHDPEQPFILFGRSLGGAIATYLATEIQSPDLLILESTFTSAPNVCARWAHPYLAALMSYQFNSLARIPKLSCPLYMIHGTDDRIVDHDFGRELYQACRTRAEFISVVGAGHNNLQDKAQGLYEETLRRWLASVEKMRL